MTADRLVVRGARRRTWRYIRWMRTAAALAGLALIAALLAPVPARAQGAEGVDAPRISMADFKKLVAARNVVIVDARADDVFPPGHIACALLLPLERGLRCTDASD